MLYRREGVKVRSDAALKIRGPLDALRVEGEATLTDGRYTKPVDFILPLLRRGQPPTGNVGNVEAAINEQGLVGFGIGYATRRLARSRDLVFAVAPEVPSRSSM